jgi:hypothetical protein
MHATHIEGPGTEERDRDGRFARDRSCDRAGIGGAWCLSRRRIRHEPRTRGGGRRGDRLARRHRGGHRCGSGPAVGGQRALARFHRHRSASRSRPRGRSRGVPITSRRTAGGCRRRGRLPRRRRRPPGQNADHGTSYRFSRDDRDSPAAGPAQVALPSPGGPAPRCGVSRPCVASCAGLPSVAKAASESGSSTNT